MDDAQIHRIEQFFSGNLSKEEASALLMDIQSDQELKKAFRERELLQGIAELAIENDLRAQMQSWDGSAENVDAGVGRGARIRSIRRPLIWLTAACIAGFAVFMTVVQFKKVSNDTLYADFYQTPEFNTNYTRGSGTKEAVRSAQIAIIGHKSDRYANAIGELEALPSADSLYADAQLVLGHLYLLTGQLDKARQKFEIALLAFPQRQVEINWYRALLELKDGNSAKAQELLTEINKSSNAEYATRAAELLTKLQSGWRIGG